MTTTKKRTRIRTRTDVQIVVERNKMNRPLDMGNSSMFGGGGGGVNRCITRGSCLCERDCVCVYMHACMCICICRCVYI